MKKKYDCYVGGKWFAKHEAKSIIEAKEKTRLQIENLHPLNMSHDNVENYRNRFRGQEIECFEEYTKHKYNSK